MNCFSVTYNRRLLTDHFLPSLACFCCKGGNGLYMAKSRGHHSHQGAGLGTDSSGMAWHFVPLMPHWGSHTTLPWKVLTRNKLTWRIMLTDKFLNLNVLKTNGSNIYKRSRLMKNRRKEVIALHWGTLKFHYHQRQFINLDCILDWKTVTIEAMCGTVGTIRAWTMCWME